MRERGRRGGGTAMAGQLTLGNPESTENLVAGIRAEWGGIDVFVNCAGDTNRGPYFGTPFESIAMESWQSSLDADLVGACRVRVAR